MRIISGKFKGKKIQQPKDDNTRPLKDLTKESIFNIIEHSKKINFGLTGSLVLDLFSGVGSFGIECLSRGAKKIIFIENADPGYDWIFSYNIKGLVTKYGGVASHMAIRCAEFDIPAAIGCGVLKFDKLKNSKRILLDCKNCNIKSIL